MCGPAALGVQLTFLEDWCWATDRLPVLDWKVPQEPSGDVPVLVLPSGPADEHETCSLLFLHAIGSAQRRLWITSPYFVPDEAVVAALQLAALRGVDVRIMLPAKADNRLAYDHFHNEAAVGADRQVDEPCRRAHPLGVGMRRVGLQARIEALFQQFDDEHYHLVIETPDGSLSKGMRQLNGGQRLLDGQPR